MGPWLAKLAAVVALDLLLAGDNAIALALVGRNLPRASLKLVLGLGTAGAVLARVVLTLIVAAGLALPGIRLFSGALLGLLALNLSRPEDGTPAQLVLNRHADLFIAALSVMLIDIVMSLDNVVALAAVAGDSPLILALGLLISVALLMFASVAVGQLLHHYPELVRLGAALLGGVGGQMAISDPLIAAWVQAQSPSLTWLVPAAAAAYIYLMAAPPAAPVIQHIVIPKQQPPAPAPSMQPRRAISESGLSSEQRDLLMLLGLFLLVGIGLTIAAFLGSGFAQ